MTRVRRTLVSFVLLSIAALGSTAVRAQAPESASPGILVGEDLVRDCRTLLKSISELVREAGLTPELDFNVVTPTVRSILVESGRHGGHLITLERTGETWGSNHATVGFDQQGDPRWFIEVVGAEAAGFFGFRLLDDRHMTIPDYSEFTGALAKVNVAMVARGEPPLPLGYYPTHSSTNTPVSVYVDRFLEDRAIPIAPDGNHLFHDLSFHTGGIFVPPAFLDFKIARIRYERSFFRFVRTRIESTPESERAIHFLEFANDFENTVSIDSGTAAVNPAVPEYLRVAAGIPSEEFFGTVAMDFTGGELSPYESFLDRLRKFESRAQMGWGNTKPARMLESLRIVSLAKLEALLREFTVQPGISGTASFDPRKSFGTTTAQDHLACDGVNRKRLEVREIAIALSRHRTP